jgi:hypothetical protein
MATKNQTSRLGKKPATVSGLRETAHEKRFEAVMKMVAAMKALNAAERTNCLAAVAEFYGLTLVVEN